MTSAQSPDEELSIGDVAARTGLSVHALRFYEQQDLLLAPVRRTAGGRRVYHREDVDWLHICTRLRTSGMPLADLRAFAALVRQGPGNEDQRLALLRKHRQQVQAQLHELQGCLELISWKVGVYEQHLARGTTRGVWDPTTATDEQPPG
ncbi:MerR family transcriptional regulator [Saccharopolyspora halophila]|uniref:MerR family transcriptional regulator n=1 Tax=Saccharopolyspora halophila TaxID=405551 RepID=A0ABN3GIB8_9PSEU